MVPPAPPHDDADLLLCEPARSVREVSGERRWADERTKAQLRSWPVRRSALL